MHASSDSSLFLRKILLTSLCLNGIFINSKKRFRIAGMIIYNLSWLTCTNYPAFCIAHNKLIDIYSVLIVSFLFTLILWWIIYLQQNEIYKLICHISIQSPRLNLLQKSFLVFFLVVGSPPSVLYMCYAYFGFVNRPISHPCFPQNTLFSKYTMFTGQVMIPGVMYGIVYSTLLLFCISYYSILKNMQATARNNSHKNVLSVWLDVTYAISIIQQIERTLTFPVLLAFCKVSVHAFTVITALCSGNVARQAKVYCIIIAAHGSGWLFLMVILADAVQEYCLEALNKTFSRLKKLKYLSTNLNYFYYKMLKASTVLTVEKMFRMQRSIIFSAITFTVSYGVIISQFKMG